MSQIESVYDRITFLRVRRGWSERELCRRAKVADMLLEQLRIRTQENRGASVSTKTAAALARALGVTPEFIRHGPKDGIPVSPRDQALLAATLLGYPADAIDRVRKMPDAPSRPTITWFRIVELEESDPGSGTDLVESSTSGAQARRAPSAGVSGLGRQNRRGQ